MTAMTSPAPSLDRLRTDAVAWDAFVEASETPFPLQLTAWATAKMATGWTAERVVVDGGSGPIGGQVLIRRLGPGLFGFGYIPRGPVATTFDRPSIEAFTAAVLGGIGNLRGALVGGLILGVAENYGSAIIGTQWKDVVAFVLLVVILLFRPTGLLGESLGKARV